jgi:outer membrane protein assembly factor BamD
MALVRSRARLIVARCICLLALAALASACASGPKRPPVGAEEPDKFLWEHGNEALKDRRWLVAREFLRQLMDSYPQSPFRASAKLGVADSFLGEGTAESRVMAINEFREFLSYYPTHELAHYAQFKLGMAHYYEMPNSARDQTETKEAIRELTTYVERFPDRPLIEEARQRLREAKDRLGDHEYAVGLFYLRSRMSVPGAVDRFNALIKADPQYTHRDAVYYQMAQALVQLGQPAAAIPYLDRLLKEFEQSEYLDRAQKQIAELKAKLDSQVKKSGGSSDNF